MPGAIDAVSAELGKLSAGMAMNIEQIREMRQEQKEFRTTFLALNEEMAQISSTLAGHLEDLKLKSGWAFGRQTALIATMCSGVISFVVGYYLRK